MLVDLLVMLISHADIFSKTIRRKIQFPKIYF